VWVRIEDMHQIAEFLKIRFRDFVRQYVRKIGTRYSLIEKSNQDCVFYDSGCTIYPVRPGQCQTFPFWKENLENPGSWQKTAKDCEGMNQGRVYSEEEIDALLLEDQRSSV
jgi:Fe-S-cluster containining protein